MNNWCLSGYEKYKKSSIDHIKPKAKGGTNDLSNLQFLSWFENRCKNDMTQDEWNILKSNIGEYFVK
jgi:5-methylcytosine-specific restriction endonuclease McrA